MRKLTLIATTAVAFAGSGLLMSTSANAAQLGAADAIRAAAAEIGIVEDAQYVWGGRRHCWYPNGWRGPGWYWCGYAHRRGYGWGGPRGWRGWR